MCRIAWFIPLALLLCGSGCAQSPTSAATSSPQQPGEEIPPAAVTEGPAQDAQVLASAGDNAPSTLGAAEESKDHAAGGSSEFQSWLLDIAAEYLTYSLVDPRGNWAPTLCAAPSRILPSPTTPLVSRSDDSETHGQKLYYLFVQDEHAYRRSSSHDNPVGQAIVKESWHPRELAADDSAQPDSNADVLVVQHASGAEVVPRASRAGKFYETAEQADLFIMFKLDPATPGTDQGWVYGTVTPDGQTATSAGRVANCMSCHRDAPRDRLFGPKTDRTPNTDVP